MFHGGATLQSAYMRTYAAGAPVWRAGPALMVGGAGKCHTYLLTPFGEMFFAATLPAVSIVIYPDRVSGVPWGATGSYSVFRVF